ncbi:hypothetical protein PISMIDRAFT_673068 [Pisolithus microcarpus 441]|uniref:Unplaced genomic scaffold scaffold_7, whole genome shotgun sequence n=1 Tax=Pisolithus microcarpus 441 TaxID=765257 RepID=A0A0C9ZHT5_9AGAM|nr:hypothetical protein PISMIDRAFT_673068 [Pisolithus microcarpus 441]
MAASSLQNWLAPMFVAHAPKVPKTPPIFETPESRPKKQDFSFCLTSQDPVQHWEW